jgi:hypothetical protein
MEAMLDVTFRANNKQWIDAIITARILVFPTGPTSTNWTGKEPQCLLFLQLRGYVGVIFDSVQ